MTEQNPENLDLFEPDVDLDFIAATEQAHDDGRPPIAVICGSTRFRADIEAANHDLTMQGYIVLAPGVFGHSLPEGVPPLDDEDKAALDRLHLRKIDLADVVMVVNPGGYIGDSTLTEVAYANSLGKPVLFSEPAAEND